MIFGKYINRYYLKNAPLLLLGLAALVLVDFFQLKVPELYRMVINGTNSGEVVVDGQTMAFTMDVLLDKICLPMIWIILAMVFGRFLWRVCFFNAAVGRRPISATRCSTTAACSLRNTTRSIR